MKVFSFSRQRKSGFTLIELMVVILIVSVLAGVGVSIFRGKVDSAKWSEANTAAGTIRRAVSAYVGRSGVAAARTNLVGKKLDDSATQGALGFTTSDLKGTYFAAGDYTVIAINGAGHATIEVTCSGANGPSGTKTLAADGSWQ